MAMVRKAEQKQNFLQGAFVLSMATAIVKIIGALFKIPIQNLLQEDGSTHFNVAYLIYSTLFVLSTTGLPVAISKMVSEAETDRRYMDSKLILRSAFLIFMLIGLICSIIMFAAAPFLASVMNDPGAVTAIRAISPAVFFVCLICPYRGYYQGKSNMVPTAVSQVVEATGKLIFGLTLTLLVVSMGGAVEVQAAAAIGGVTLGTLLSAIYLISTGRARGTMALQHGVQVKNRKDSFLPRLMSIAIPITLSSAVISLTNLIDASMVLGRLKQLPDFGGKIAEHYYGAYTWATTLFNLPPSFILTISVSIIPALTAAKAKRDHKGVTRTMETALRTTALLAMPAAGGLMSLSWPIINLFYSKYAESKEIVEGSVRYLVPGGAVIAAPLLATLSIAILFVCLVSLTNAMLQALGMASIPLVTMTLGAISKIICNYTLVSNPSLNINGAPFGTIICYAMIAGLNLIVIMRVTGVGARILLVFIKPMIATVGMGFVSAGIYYLVEKLIGAKLAVIIAIITGVLAYGIFVVLLRVVTKDETTLLPKGDKVAKFMGIK